MSSISRSELAYRIGEDTEAVKNMFVNKNQDYGKDGEAFANFRKTAERILIPFVERCGGKCDIYDAMFTVAQVYIDKHAVALSHTGVSGKEAKDRLIDIAVYSMICKAMIEEGEER